MSFPGDKSLGGILEKIAAWIGAAIGIAFVVLFLSNPSGFIGAIVSFFNAYLIWIVLIILALVVFLIIVFCFPGVLIFLLLAVAAVVIFFIVAFLLSIF